MSNIEEMEELIKNYLVKEHKMIRETIVVTFPDSGSNIHASGSCEGVVNYVSCSVRIV